MPDDAEIREAKERMVTASKLASSWLGGYLAARHDGNRAHIEESLGPLKAALTNNVTLATDVIAGRLLQSDPGAARQRRRGTPRSRPLGSALCRPGCDARGRRPARTAADSPEVGWRATRGSARGRGAPCDESVVVGCPPGDCLLVELVAANPTEVEVDVNVLDNTYLGRHEFLAHAWEHYPAILAVVSPEQGDVHPLLRHDHKEAG